MLYGAAVRQGDLDWLQFVNTTFDVAMFGHQNDDLRRGVRRLLRRAEIRRSAQTGFPTI